MVILNKLVVVVVVVIGYLVIAMYLSELPRFWECIGGEGGVNDGHDSR